MTRVCKVSPPHLSEAHKQNTGEKKPLTHLEGREATRREKKYEAIVLSSFSFLPAQFTEPNLIRLLNHPTPSSSHPGVTSIEPHRLNLPLRDSPHPPIYDNQPLLQATNAPQLQNKERKNKKQKKKTSEEIKSSFNLISFMSSDSTRSLTLNHSKDHLIILHPPPHQHQWPMLTRSHSIRSIRSLPI